MKKRIILSLTISSLILGGGIVNFPAFAQGTANLPGSSTNPVVEFPDTNQDAGKSTHKKDNGHIIPEKVSPEDECELKRSNDELQKSKSHFRHIKKCPEQGIQHENKSQPSSNSTTD